MCVDLNRQTGKMEMPVSPQQGRELLRARCFLKHGKARLNDESDMLNARSRGQFHLETTRRASSRLLRSPNKLVQV